MNANLDFRFNDIVQPLVSARRKELADVRILVETAQRILPPGAVVIVMSKAHEDQLPLEGHQVWAFPDRAGKQTQRHFASGSDGSAEASWIGVASVYEFAYTEALRKKTCSLQSQSGKMEARLTRLPPTKNHVKTELLSRHGRTQFQREQNPAKPRSAGARATAHQE